MIFTHIGMRQHIIAELLAVTQTCTMAQHQPGMRPQHCNVVGNGFGIGRANANIDHGDARMITALQMIGGHLRQSL
ncbi:hypothetical protein FQZ97_1192770 [compost metagenome]